MHLIWAEGDQMEDWNRIDSITIIRAYLIPSWSFPRWLIAIYYEFDIFNYPHISASQQVFVQLSQLMNEPREGFFILTFSYIELFSWFMDVQVTLFHGFFLHCTKPMLLAETRKVVSTWSQTPQPPPRTESVLKAERIAGEQATAQIASEQHGKQNVTLNPWL